MSSDTPLNPSTLYFTCIPCHITFRSYVVAAAHVSAKHDDQRPERFLDVLQIVSEPARGEYIASCRAEHARDVLASAVKAQETHLKRRIGHSPEESPIRRPKAHRLAANTAIKDKSVTTAMQLAMTKHNHPSPAGVDAPVPAPALRSNPTFLLRARGAHIPFTPPQGVDSYDGLLASVMAAYDEAVPGASEFDWIAAANQNWEVVVGRVGGGRSRTIVISSDEEAMSCLRKELMEMAGSRIRIMEIGEQD